MVIYHVGTPPWLKREQKIGNADIEIGLNVIYLDNFLNNRDVAGNSHCSLRRYNKARVT